MYAEPYTPTTGLGSNWGSIKQKSFSFGSNVKYTTKQNFVFQLGLQYESLNSKSNIDTFYFSGFVLTKSAVNGSSITNNKAISINTLFGKQFMYKKMQIQLLTGLQLAHSVGLHLNAALNNSTSSFTQIKNKLIKQPFFDVRTNITINIFYKKFGLNIGHQQGFVNLTKENKKAYTSILQTGIVYKIKSN